MFVADDVFRQAKTFERKSDLHEAVKALLIGKAAFASNDQVRALQNCCVCAFSHACVLQPNTRKKRGTDATQFLADLLKQLSGDPHLALKVAKGEKDESVIKKSYRKMALKYHPDKLKVI